MSEPKPLKPHELVHNDGGPDWCAHCGMFSHWTPHYPNCEATEKNKWGKPKLTHLKSKGGERG